MMDSLLVNDKPILYYLQEPRRTGEIHEGVLDELLQKYPASEHLHYLKLVQHFLATGDWDRDLLTKAASHTNDRQVLHRRMASVAELAAVSPAERESPELEQSPLSDELPSEQVGPAADSAQPAERVEPKVVKTIIIADPEPPEPIKVTKKKKKKKRKKPKPSRLHKALVELNEAEAAAKPSDFVAWLKQLEDVARLREVASVQGKSSKRRKPKKKKKLEPILDETPISETLASLLAKQGRILQAQAMYEQLSLKYPEKSSFFAAKIKALADKN